MPKYLVTFTRVHERTYVVEADEEDVAINIAWGKLQANDSTDSETDSDWSVKTGAKTNTLACEDRSYIRHNVSTEALRWITTRLCKETVEPDTPRSLLVLSVINFVEDDVVSMDAVRATNTQLSLHRAAAIAKLSVDERIALGVE
jgi:hypothetical protein